MSQKRPQIPKIDDSVFHNTHNFVVLANFSLTFCLRLGLSVNPSSPLFECVRSLLKVVEVEIDISVGKGKLMLSCFSPE